MYSRIDVRMDTPFGPFEPTVELNDDARSYIMRALDMFEQVMSTADGFSIDISEGQPLIVKTINGKRLELPVFEAAELDAQRFYGYPPTHQVPIRVDGRSQNVLTSAEFDRKIDAQITILVIVQNMDSGAPDWFWNLFK